MEVQLFDPGAHLCFDPGEVMERTRVAEVQAMDSRYDTGTREAPMHSWEMSARHGNHGSIWVFPKIVGFSPQIIHF